MDKIQSKEELVKKIIENNRDLNASNISEELLHKLIYSKLARDINDDRVEHLKFSEKLADKIASFGGSWPFIISFGSILIFWILINTILLASRAFDPYPFILLNLVLSCLSALQAPIIMMSQNRQSEKDRLTAANEYIINLKTEIIIEDLHIKIDKLLEQHEKNEKTIDLLKNSMEELKLKK